MADSILCPQCETEIALNDAVTRSLRDQFNKEFASKAQALEEKVATRERQLLTQREEMEKRQQTLEAEVAQKIEVGRRKLAEEAQQQARASVGLEVQAMTAKLAEREKKLEEAQRNELALRQKAEAVEERARNLDLELARKLDIERAKVQEEARRQAAEDQQLRLADKEKLINDLKNQIESLKQKAEQGSQQSQGEVLELQLEETIRQAFPLDVLRPVPQGTRGADLVQEVHGPLGQTCGTIIWESKRTKNWSPGWLAKLKDDQRALGADIAILVTQALPDGFTYSGFLEGVWICDFRYALALATALRSGLLRAAAVQRAESGKGEKMEVLYQFLTSQQFRHQIEAVVEAFVEMKKDLDSERRAMEKLWKKRDQQLVRVLNGTSGLYGSLQGIVGSAALPEIRVLELGGEDTVG